MRRKTDRQVRFTIAVIALGAKLAKADGTVSVSEVRAFRYFFRIDAKDEKHAARVFNYARQSTAGFEAYGRAVASLFPRNHRILEGVLEGLFHVALADGELDEREAAFLFQLNSLFGLTDEYFDRLLHRFTEEEEANPYKVLGVSPEEPLAEIRMKWRGLVRQHHPDILVAEGLPHEAIRLAERRLADYNNAWERIRSERSA